MQNMVVYDKSKTNYPCETRTHDNGIKIRCLATWLRGIKWLFSVYIRHKPQCTILCSHYTFIDRHGYSDNSMYLSMYHLAF